MRVAQVAPLFESVPPKYYYGGTERVVSYLTEELVRQDHEVTLLASGHLETKAHLVFDQRFTAARMAHDYVQVCERVIKNGQKLLEARG
jgi:hypothetical protein